MKRILTTIVGSMAAVLCASSAPETSLSYNRLNVSYVHLESDANNDIDVSSNGALINLQVSPVESFYFNIGGTFESAEADDFDIEVESFEGLLGVGTYLPLSDIIHLILGAGWKTALPKCAISLR